MAAHATGAKPSTRTSATAAKARRSVSAVLAPFDIASDNIARREPMSGRSNPLKTRDRRVCPGDAVVSYHATSAPAILRSSACLPRPFGDVRRRVALCPGSGPGFADGSDRARARSKPVLTAVGKVVIIASALSMPALSTRASFPPMFAW